MNDPTTNRDPRPHRLRCRIDHPKAAAALRLIPRQLSPTFVAHCILWALEDAQAMLPWAPYLVGIAPEERNRHPPAASPAEQPPAREPRSSEPDLSFLGGFGADLPKGPRP